MGVEEVFFIPVNLHIHDSTILFARCIKEIKDIYKKKTKERGGGEYILTHLIYVLFLFNVFRRAVEVLEGEVDGLVNCAGVTTRLKLEDGEEETFDWIMNINVKVFYISQYIFILSSILWLCGYVVVWLY